MESENISGGNKKILGINKYVYGLFPHMDRHIGNPKNVKNIKTSDLSHICPKRKFAALSGNAKMVEDAGKSNYWLNEKIYVPWYLV